MEIAAVLQPAATDEWISILARVAGLAHCAGDNYCLCFARYPRLTNPSMKRLFGAQAKRMA